MMLNDVIRYIQKRKWFLLPLILLHAGYFIYALCVGNIYTADSNEYIQMANNILGHGEVYSYYYDDCEDPFYYSLRPPIYGLFIALLKLISPAHGFILFIQNLMSICVWLIVVSMANGQERYKHVLQFAIIIGLLFFPSNMIMVNSIMADILLQFLMVLSFLFFIRSTEADGLAYFFFYQIILVLAVFTKPILLFFWLPNLLFSIYWFRKKIPMSMILLTCMIMPTCIFIWSLRNESKTGYFHFSSIQEQNLLDLNAGSVLVSLYGENKATHIKNELLKNAYYTHDFRTENLYLRQASLSIIKKHPVRYFYLHIKGMFNFMLASGRVDMVGFFNIHEPHEMNLIREIEKNGWQGVFDYFNFVDKWMAAYMLLITTCNVVVFLSLAGCVFKVHKLRQYIKRESLVYIFLFIFYYCLIAGPYGYARFKVAVFPFLMIVMTIALLQFVLRKSTKFNSNKL